MSLNKRRGLVNLVIALVCLEASVRAGTINETTALQCYDCDPQNHKNQCSDPAKYSVPYVNCEEKFPNRTPNSTRLICLSAIVVFHGLDVESSGIYRGCKEQPPSVLDYCDLFQEEVNNLTAILVSCTPCSTSRCNGSTDFSVSNATLTFLLAILCLVQ